MTHWSPSPEPLSMAAAEVKKGPAVDVSTAPVAKAHCRGEPLRGGATIRTVTGIVRTPARVPAIHQCHVACICVELVTIECPVWRRSVAYILGRDLYDLRCRVLLYGLIRHFLIGRTCAESKC